MIAALRYSVPPRPRCLRAAFGPAVAAGLLFAPASLHAGPVSGAKDAAPAKLRELSTDRPDTTESPFTVDHGHFQFEWELASAVREGGRWTDYTLFEVNAKYGLTKSTDIQFVLPLFTGRRGGDEGTGDLTIRLKHNLRGNDGGPAALAVMPFVKLPTAGGGQGNGKVEGGLIVPFAFDGPDEWNCGIMAELDLVADDAGRFHPELLLSATASRQLSETTAAFMEVAGILDFRSGTDPEIYFNTGLTRAMTEHWQLDAGLRIGLTGSADDLAPFLGVSVKY